MHWRDERFTERMLLVIFRAPSCRKLLTELLQVTEMPGWPRVLVGWIVGEQADDVGARGGQDVLHVCFRQPFMSAVA